MGYLLLGISGRVEAGETLTARVLPEGTASPIQWQAFVGGNWINVGAAGSSTYVVPANAAGISYRIVSVSDGQTFTSAATAPATLDSKKASASVLTGADGTWIGQENMSGVGMFTNVTFSDADRTSFAGGSLMVLNTQNGPLNSDVLAIRFTVASKFSYNAATGDVLYTATGSSPMVIGRIDSLLNGNGTDLKIVFTANASHAIINALIDNLTLSNNDDSPVQLRLLTLRITDPNGGSAQRTELHEIYAQPDAPVFTSAAALALDENTTLAGQVAAIDPDRDTNQGQGIVYSLVGTDSTSDSRFFTIDAATGALRFIVAPDYEDVTHGPVYSVRVRATDTGGDVSEQDLIVAVRNGNEAPVVQPLAGVAQEDGQPITLTASFSDEQAGGHTITIDTSNTLGLVTQNGANFTYVVIPEQWQHLNAGDSVTDSFSYTVTDSAGLSSTALATVQIVGVNDIAAISGVSSADITDPLGSNPNTISVGGKLTVSDVDMGQARFVARASQPGDGSLGHFNIIEDGTWTYGIDGDVVQHMGAGATFVDKFMVASLDGTASRELQVTLYGTNDAPVVTGGDITGAVSEQGVMDSGANAPGMPYAQGVLTATDVDDGDTRAWSGSATGTYGAFEINAVTGAWSYMLDNDRVATNALAEGQVVVDTFTVTVTDAHGASSQQQVSITVEGANDFVALSDSSQFSAVVQEASADRTGMQFEPALGIARELVVLSDGRMILAGSVRNSPDTYSALAAINGDGSLDTSFGTSGLASLGDVFPLLMTADAAGRVLLESYGVLLRYTADGSLDNSFANAGSFQLPWGFYMDAEPMFDAQGHIYLSGIVREDMWDPPMPTVLRLNADGTSDPSFGVDGRWLVPMGQDEVMQDFAVDSQGRLLVLSTDSAFEGQSYVSRYLQDRTPDTSFGDGGRIALGTVVDGEIHLASDSSMAFDTKRYTGEIGAFELDLLRINSDGTRDMSFGDAGEATLPLYVNSCQVTFDSEDRLVIGFTVYESTNLHALRLNPDASLDTTFGASGQTTVDFGQIEHLWGIEAKPDGGVMLLGWTFGSTYHSVLAALDSAGQLDTGFGELPSQEVSASGTLVVLNGDPDSGDTLQWTGSADGVMGEFMLTPQGSWTYVLDGSSPLLQELDEGELATETFTATLTDSYGASVSHDVVITIVGSYDPSAP